MGRCLLPSPRKKSLSVVVPGSLQNSSSVQDTNPQFFAVPLEWRRSGVEGVGVNIPHLPPDCACNDWGGTPSLRGRDWLSNGDTGIVQYHQCIMLLNNAGLGPELVNKLSFSEHAELMTMNLFVGGSSPKCAYAPTVHLLMTVFPFSYPFRIEWARSSSRTGG